MKPVQLAGLWEEMLRYPEIMEEKQLEEEGAGKGKSKMCNTSWEESQDQVVCVRRRH